MIGPSLSDPSMGSKGSKRASGPYSKGTPDGLKLKGVVVDEVGSAVGSSTKWWVAKMENPSPVGLAGLEGVSPGPSQV